MRENPLEIRKKGRIIQCPFAGVLVIPPGQRKTVSYRQPVPVDLKIRRPAASKRPRTFRNHCMPRENSKYYLLSRKEEKLYAGHQTEDSPQHLFHTALGKLGGNLKRKIKKFEWILLHWKNVNKNDDDDGWTARIHWRFCLLFNLRVM